MYNMFTIKGDHLRGGLIRVVSVCTCTTVMPQIHRISGLSPNWPDCCRFHADSGCLQKHSGYMTKILLTWMRNTHIHKAIKLHNLSASRNIITVTGVRKQTFSVVFFLVKDGKKVQCKTLESLVITAHCAFSAFTAIYDNWYREY